MVATGAPVTLMVAKNRSGPTVNIPLEWIGPRVTFREKNPDQSLPVPPSEMGKGTFSDAGPGAVVEEPEALRNEIEEAVRALTSEAEESKSAERDDLFG